MIKQEGAMRTGLILIVRWTRTMMCSAVSVSKISCSLVLRIASPSPKKKNVPETNKLQIFCLVVFVVTWSVSGNLPVGLSATLKTV